MTSLPDSAVVASALISPAGELSLFILNKTKEPVTVQPQIATFEGKTLNLYQVTAAAINASGFQLNPQLSFVAGKQKEITLPGESITTISSYNLQHNDKGIIIQ